MLSNKRWHRVTFFSLIILYYSFVTACKWKDKRTSGGEKNEVDLISRGQLLAQDYCRRCHLFPSPELLDKKTWNEGVLPNMAWRLGIRETGSNPYTDMVPREEDIIRKIGVYPETPLIPHSDWLAIKKYYEERSPLNPLPQKKVLGSPLLLSRFETKLINFGNNPLPQTTLVEYDKYSSQLYVGDAKKNLYILNAKFELEESWQTDSAPVDIDFPKGGTPRLLTIGDFSPSDQKKWQAGHIGHCKRFAEGWSFHRIITPPGTICC